MSKHKSEVTWVSDKPISPTIPRLTPWIQCSGSGCTNVNMKAVSTMKKWYCPECKFCLQYVGEL